MKSQALIDIVNSTTVASEGSGCRYTHELYPYDALFSPIQCKGLTLKNRVIAVPPQRLYGISPEVFALNAVAGGAGLVCLDYGFGSGLCERIHAYGSRIFALIAPEKMSKPGLAALRRSAAEAIKLGCDGVCLDLRMVGHDKACKITNAVARTIGAGALIMCRVGIFDSYIDIARSGADILGVEPYADAAPWLRTPTEAMPGGCFLELAQQVKSGVTVPVAAYGKLGCPDIAEAAVRSGKCDMVILERTLLADPEWCKKAQSGTVDDIVPYINPYGSLLISPRAKAENPKRIAVIGGGVAGMSLALCAASRGHSADIYESGSRLGGRVLAESVPALRQDTVSYLRWLTLKLCRSDKIQFYLNSYVDIAGLSSCGYDAIVFANGGKARSAPDIPGWGEIPFVPLWVLYSAGRRSYEISGRRIAVVGGESAACECALWLKAEKHAARVTLIGQGSEIMRNSPINERKWFQKVLQTQGVELISSAVPVRISDGCLLVRQSCHAALGTPPSPAVFIRSIDCELIVLAEKELADTAQFKAAQSEYPGETVFSLTGSFSPCDIIGASRAAYELADRL